MQMLTSRSHQRFLADAADGTVSSWEKSCERAAEYVKLTIGLANASRGDFQVLPLTSSRRSCFRDASAAFDSPAWALLASYWLVYPHRSVVRFALKHVCERESTVGAGLACHLLLHWAHLLIQSDLDDVLIRLKSSVQQVDLCEAERSLLSARHNQTEFERSQKCRGLSPDPSVTTGSFLSEREALDAILSGSVDKQFAAITWVSTFCKTQRTAEVLCDRIASAETDSLRNHAAMALVFGWAGIACEQITNQLIALATNCERDLTCNLALHALLGVSGLQFIPKALLNQDSVARGKILSWFE